MNNVTITVFNKDFDLVITKDVTLTDGQVNDVRFSGDVNTTLADMFGIAYNDDDTLTTDFYDLFD